jgi:hypothetical protein
MLWLNSKNRGELEPFFKGFELSYSVALYVLKYEKAILGNT